MAQQNAWKHRWVEIGGKRCFFKSSWEYNYACYLEWLKQHGNIKDWSYEPEVFWFDNIKRGTNNYKPDFLISYFNGRRVWHEIKGYKKPKDLTKLKRMHRYYPNETVMIITGETTLLIRDDKLLEWPGGYYHIAAQASKWVPGWGEAPEPTEGEK